MFELKFSSLFAKHENYRLEGIIDRMVMELHFTRS